MAFNFRDIMDDETKRDLDEFNRRQAEYANLNDESLVATAKYCMSQCQEPQRWGRGECVYNATVWHLLMPEIIRRLENKE